MSRFKDNAGREWFVSLDVFALEQVEAQTGVKVSRLLEDKAAGLIDLMGDPVKLVRVLWVLVDDQATKAGIKPEQFGRALAGDSLEEAANAFVEAFANFCPSRQRKLLLAMTAKGTEVADREADAALKLIEAISSGSPTNSAPSPGSTPAAAG